MSRTDTRTTDALVIGGGQAGRAMSACLSEMGIEHVVLERGRIAERWRSERWDSLHMLTPRWLSRLPGYRYRGPDPDGFMGMPELIAYLERYARSCDAPVFESTTVRTVRFVDERYEVVTDRGTWLARAVVIATGSCDEPFVPAMARSLDPRTLQKVPTRYRNPGELPDGGVLVVGASATGVQLADEIHRSGRPVTLSAGRHTRLPRRYRGRDIFAWLEATGALDERAEHVPDLAASRRQPSLQLVGGPVSRSLDLGVLRDLGVRLVGRVTDADGTRLSLANDLATTSAAADAKLARLLARIDRYVGARGLDAPPEDRPSPLGLDTDTPDRLDLAAEGITTVLWATGFRRRYPWLEVPVLDASGEIRHDGGITPSPGLFVLGLGFLRRRKSSFLDGCGEDARELSVAVADLLGARRPSWAA